MAIAAEEGGEIDEIHFIFCDDDYVLEINRNFLNHDYFTDIITFPYSQEKNKLKADIYISIDTCLLYTSILSMHCLLYYCFYLFC